MDTYHDLLNAVNYIKSKTNIIPRLVLVLGSGFGGYVDSIFEKIEIPYSEIPGFANTSVSGHVGKLVFAIVNKMPIAILQGRVHYYEGVPINRIVFPLRVIRILGAEFVLFTNASGGTNRAFVPGDFMLIDDHINNTANSPLIGTNIDELGPRFPDMTYAYDNKLKECMMRAAKDAEIDLKRGVYMMFCGPQFETPAEIRFARMIGADAIGMSTVPEVIAARHCGYRICAVSCITNMAAGILDQPLTHDEVIETGNTSSKKARRLIDLFIKEINNL